MSKHHCLIRYFKEKDCYVVSDQKSTNGTLLNQSRISTDIILSENDRVQVGDIRILFKYDSFDSPTETRKILKLVKKPEGEAEQGSLTDTMRIPNLSAIQQMHAPTVQTLRLDPGTRINRYEIVELIAETGHGNLYRVHDHQDNKWRAMKIFSLQFDLRHPALEAFSSSLAVLARIDNPYFVKIRDFGTFNGHCFYVMDFLESQDLNMKIAQSAPFPEYDVLCIVYTVGAAFETALKDYSIIHGNLSPANIFIDAGNELTIIDCGIAAWLKRHYQDEKPLVSSWYASPEEIRKQGLDWRSDLYALGIIFFQLLTGQVPFRGDSDEDVFRMHLENDLPHPQAINPNIWVSDASVEILARMLVKNPEDRYANWGEFLESASNAYNQFEQKDSADPSTSTDSLNKIFDTFYEPPSSPPT
jgi:serine/threonine protein kinase